MYWAEQSGKANSTVRTGALEFQMGMLRGPATMTATLRFTRS